MLDLNPDMFWYLASVFLEYQSSRNILFTLCAPREAQVPRTLETRFLCTLHVATPFCRGPRCGWVKLSCCKGLECPFRFLSLCSGLFFV